MMILKLMAWLTMMWFFNVSAYYLLTGCVNLDGDDDEGDDDDNLLFNVSASYLLAAVPTLSLWLDAIELNCAVPPPSKRGKMKFLSFREKLWLLSALITYLENFDKYHQELAWYLIFRRSRLLILSKQGQRLLCATCIFLSWRGVKIYSWNW